MYDQDYALDDPVFKTHGLLNLLDREPNLHQAKRQRAGNGDDHANQLQEDGSQESSRNDKDVFEIAGYTFLNRNVVRLEGSAMDSGLTCQYSSGQHYIMLKISEPWSESSKSS